LTWPTIWWKMQKMVEIFWHFRVYYCGKTWKCVCGFCFLPRAKCKVLWLCFVWFFSDGPYIFFLTNESKLFLKLTINLTFWLKWKQFWCIPKTNIKAKKNMHRQTTEKQIVTTKQKLSSAHQVGPGLRIMRCMYCWTNNILLYRFDKAHKPNKTTKECPEPISTWFIRFYYFA
jgi:hypothetical protein